MKVAAAISPVAGMVISQAVRISFVIDQRTLLALYPVPTPITDEPTIWVVLTGNPRIDEKYIMMPEDICESNE